MSEVSLKKLTKVYGGTTVVDHIDLTVPDGTLTSILGPSGCGKTTTLRMIAGFETPESGDVLLMERLFPRFRSISEELAWFFKAMRCFLT